MIILGYSGFSRDSHKPGKANRHATVNAGFDGLFEFRGSAAPLTMFPLSYFGHDASAALIVDGKLVACAAEERFTRTKHSLNLAGNTLLPKNAIEYCLREAGIFIPDVDVVAHYCDFTEESVSRRLELLRGSLQGEDAERLRQSYTDTYLSLISRESVLSQFERMTGAQPKRFLPVSHHEAHAASTFFCSGFDTAVILTIDGSGELESSLLALGRGSRIEEIHRTLLPTSLGTLYLVLSVYLGFRSLGDEYKVMGLAAYGNPERYRRFFDSLVILGKNGEYYTPMLARQELKELLESRLGAPRRPEEAVEERHADIAASLQEALDRTVLHTLRHAASTTEAKYLCLAGGVALNCSMNGAVARSGLFKDIFVQPAAGDEGGSVGAALHACYQSAENGRPEARRLEDVYLGPAYGQEEVLRALRRHADALHWLPKADIAREVATRLAQGQVAGWFQGRMEFGPRALGNRSILADPRDPAMKDRINAKVKRRESFRPFAPSVLEEEAGSYFDMNGLSSSPYMLFTVPVWPSRRATIPAVTHVDGTARLQTVSRRTNPPYWQLISSFRGITGVPLVLNTSFNVRNEPIVCSPEDAIRCFLSTGIDCLAIDRYLVEKRSSP
jgi:carbamoyltransferase